MTRKFKRVFALLLCVVLCVAAMPFFATAQEPVDPEADATLTLQYRTETQALSGVMFRIYRVADINTDGSFALTDRFAGYPVSLDELDENPLALALALSGYVKRDQISADDSGRTDEFGTLVFPTPGHTMTAGLYLVLGERWETENAVYTAKPFLVSFPGELVNAQGWTYDRLAQPKYDREDLPQEGATVCRKVLKTWEDDGHEASRPEEIIVQLLRDGEVYDTVALNEENSWRYTWSDLESGHEWDIVEAEDGDYTVLIDQNGITFTITNTCDGPETPEEPDTPKDPTLPQTGTLWWPVPILLAVGLILFMLGMLLRRRNSDEG